ncbi:MAG: hypothetical protein HOM11_00570 [Methylococcales bacterium]|jgi:hypothetical protein|nr:hypothetical protein [Methylococcales bacterium]MBT7443602.1 hypothetical protein [Methylococcales bacterium]
MNGTVLQSEPKLPVTVKLNESLVNEVAILKQQFESKGKYFSITKSVERAITKAIADGKKEITSPQETFF